MNKSKIKYFDGKNLPSRFILEKSIYPRSLIGLPLKGLGFLYLGF
jgi:hypothetical protein